MANIQKQLMRAYIRYSRIRRGKRYIYRLLKASMLFSIAPLMILAVYVINDKLATSDALYGTIFIVLISILFVRPYLTDLTALTSYVEQLSLDRRAEPPELSFLSNVEELSAAVNHLQQSWEGRKRQLETAITESKVVFDTLPDAVLILDKQLKIIRTNNIAHQLFGAHLHRKKIEEITTNATLIDTAETVLKKGIGKYIEVVFDDMPDKYYAVSAEPFPIKASADIALIIVVHDITESKHTEQMFADFVANASHEIRTPLTSIVGLIETLQDGAMEDKKVAKNFLRIMAEQSERMSRLVEELLSLSKIERDAHELPTDNVDVMAVLRGVKKQTLWLAEDKAIDIKIQKKNNIPVVTGDVNELMQVFTNLTSNAIKYGRKESVVRLEAEYVEALTEEVSGLEKGKSFVKVSVQDQGEGIEAKHIPRLTERFYRVDTARSRKIGGIGLGLAIVKHIINHHQGGLKIESELGKGSVFAVYLPV